MNNYRAYTVDAFTKTLGQGNRAGVIFLDDPLDDESMQNLAQELNYPETAFITKTSSTLYQYEIRYFTPVIEVPLCGHATIASFYTLAKINKLQSQNIKFNTKVGILDVDIILKDGDYLIAMSQGNISVDKPSQDDVNKLILTALNLDIKYLSKTLPITTASCGNPKYMIPINSYNALLDLKPNFNVLKQISLDTHTSGYYLFYLDNNNVYGRMFAPSSGNSEDITTGVANAALVAYLVKYQKRDDSFILNITQGNSVQKGQMKVNVTFKNQMLDKIQIIGTAIIHQ